MMETLLTNSTELNALQAGQDITLTYVIDLSNPDNTDDVQIAVGRT